MTTTGSRRTGEAPTRDPVGLLLGPVPAAQAVDLALVIARVALAWIFIYYGAGKLFGAFGGAGIDQTSTFMADTAGLRPGGLFAVVAGLIELVGGAAIALGLATRVAGVALAGNMVMAIVTVTGSRGLHGATATGYELNLALAALALVVAVLGAGRLSLDAVLHERVRGGAARRGDGAGSDNTTPGGTP